MKIRLTILGCAAVALTGCTAPDTANTKRNRDDLARIEERAKGSAKNDGSLGSDYAVDLLLNGSGKKSTQPVFDQPMGAQPTR